MQLEDMILVSVDDHLVEPPSMSDYFADHFPAKYQDRVPRLIHREDGTDAWLIEGNEVSSFGLNAVAGRVREELVAKTAWSYTYSQPKSPIDYHGTVEIRPIDKGHSKLLYTLVYDADALPKHEPADKAADKDRRTKQFTALVTTMKAAAEAK